MCVYEKARVDDETGVLGTGLGCVVAEGGLEDESEDCIHEVVIVDWRGDSESDALSQASSSAQSAD